MNTRNPLTAEKNIGWQRVVSNLQRRLSTNQIAAISQDPVALLLLACAVPLLMNLIALLAALLTAVE